MRYKNLGKTGTKVSELCLGTMIFGQQVDETTAVKIINRAVDLGINFIDTADVYAKGRSEEIVGNAIRGMRDDIVLATKVRGRTGPDPNGEGLSRKHIMRNLETSLKRLGTDYIDLYQVHRVDPATPLKETMATLSDLVRSGKVRYIGCSNFPAWQLEKALRISEVQGVEAFATVQPRYNVVDRDIERELLPLCVEEGIGVIPYSPLAGGILTGKYHLGKPAPEGSRGQLRPVMVSRYLNPRNQAILQVLEEVSSETGMSLSQISLAWLMANPAITSPIVGASKLEQLEENIGVLDHSLPVETLTRISEASKPDWLRDQEEFEALMRRAT
ncbi:MAG: aldo/keto reductase [Nitrososphaerales archaeon]|jgi:aryl-alcohol dehydrogenase-like predicted oxidoreductase